MTNQNVNKNIRKKNCVCLSRHNIHIQVDQLEGLVYFKYKSNKVMHVIDIFWTLNKMLMKAVFGLQSSKSAAGGTVQSNTLFLDWRPKIYRVSFPIVNLRPAQLKIAPCKGAFKA